MLTEPFETFLNTDEFSSELTLPDGRVSKIIWDENWNELLDVAFSGREILAYGLRSELQGIKIGQTVIHDGRSYSVDLFKPVDDGLMAELTLREL